MTCVGLWGLGSGIRSINRFWCHLCSPPWPFSSSSSTLTSPPSMHSRMPLCWFSPQYTHLRWLSSHCCWASVSTGAGIALLAAASCLLTHCQNHWIGPKEMPKNFKDIFIFKTRIQILNVKSPSPWPWISKGVVALQYQGCCFDMASWRLNHIPSLLTRTSLLSTFTLKETKTNEGNKLDLLPSHFSLPLALQIPWKHWQHWYTANGFHWCHCKEELLLQCMKWNGPSNHEQHHIETKLAFY